MLKDNNAAVEVPSTFWSSFSTFFLHPLQCMLTLRMHVCMVKRLFKAQMEIKKWLAQDLGSTRSKRQREEKEQKVKVNCLPVSLGTWCLLSYSSLSPDTRNRMFCVPQSKCSKEKIKRNPHRGTVRSENFVTPKASCRGERDGYRILSEKMKKAWGFIEEHLIFIINSYGSISI